MNALNDPSPHRLLVRALKGSATLGGPSLSIPIGCPVEALLRPVATDFGRLNSSDVRLLTCWRNRFVHAFLTEFEATDARTASWLVDVVGPDDSKLLFMLDSAQTGVTFGYMGLAFIDWDSRTAEADAIVRGGWAPPGQMLRALRTMIDWAQRALRIPRIYVRVRSDNAALRFYERVGFAELKRVPLRMVSEGQATRWVEDALHPDQKLTLVHMELHDHAPSDDVSLTPNNA